MVDFTCALGQVINHLIPIYCLYCNKTILCCLHCIFNMASQLYKERKLDCSWSLEATALFFLFHLNIFPQWDRSCLTEQYSGSEVKLKLLNSISKLLWRKQIYILESQQIPTPNLSLGGETHWFSHLTCLPPLDRSCGL